ncbi:HlyD family efflux transporter periplasmic adaptor subunit [Paenibacillus hexagrammi]|uniref:HlyD family efflux transporter periplasmic adaptor subunit n=1 Tax=Paenibacillus hexagrammi TaxID=2908839 RepID=A0ABY3SK53_9BACL|nr:HlyD family efflux transporter periplasmic adaptor subunit [Paenibacillus sp. YPD9-1]UJF34232.1 HlyD family efflux transporter periplasmic adaptor subunit [Paenibacillus sp. YPD9-1]
MSMVMRELKELTDSRELYEAKAHPAISIFLYLLVTLLVVALIWSYFGEIDTVVKGSGVVRPNEKVSTIKNKVTGTVSAVHYKAGQKVKKGDLLVSFESKDVDVQGRSLQADYNKTKAELAGLLKFKAGLMEENGGEEAHQQLDFQSDQVTLQNLMLELSSNKISVKQIEEELSRMQVLDESIREGRNLFTENTSEYYNKYEDYQIKKAKLENTQKQQEQAYVQVTKSAVAEDVKAAKKQFDDARLDYENYVNEYQLNLRASIEDSKRKLETLKLERDKVYVELNNAIQADEDQIKKLDEQLAVSSFDSEDREIKASADGIVNVLVELREGDLVGAGTEIATIVPEASSEYTVQVSIPNKDIAKIKAGDQIKYHFLALPYKEYGELTGTITTVSADAILNQESGSSYYAVEAAIQNKPLYNSKGEVSHIKPGMLAEANVVTGSKSILDYLLEKIDLKD